MITNSQIGKFLKSYSHAVFIMKVPDFAVVYFNENANALYGINEKFQDFHHIFPQETDELKEELGAAAPKRFCYYL